MLISTAQAGTKCGPRKSQFRRRRFTGCSCTFLDMKIILHGRCKESVTYGGQKREFTWQAQGIGHIVKIVAGAVFRGRGRRVSFEGLRFTWQAQGIRTMDPIFWGQRAQFLRGVAFLELELGDAFAWPVQHFVWPRLMISWQAQYFWSTVSKCEPSAEIVRVQRAECRWNCVFGFRSATLCGDRACRVRGMQVKLRFWISKCNPLRRSCVSSARNAGEIAISDFEVQPSAEIVRVECAECRWNCDFGLRSATLCGDQACPSREMLVKLRFLISYKDLAQEVLLQDPDAEILTERSCTRDPHTEILHKRSYRILMQRSWQRDLAQEIHIQRSCTRGPTGSWCRHHDREILDKRSADRDLAQEVLQDPDADIMTERSWTKDPHTEILHKWSYRILMQRSWQRDFAQEIRRQKSCTSGFAQVVIQDPDAEIVAERSCTRDPHTEILHKRSYRILVQTSCQRDLGQEIHIQRSCTRGPTGSWCRHPDREILHKRFTYRDLAQVVLEILTEKSCTRDPHTEILHKRSYRILMQTSWQRDLGQEILIQRSCTRGPTGSWCWDPDREILHKRSTLQRSCTSGPTGSWCRHHDREILDKRSARSCTRGPTGSWCRHHDRGILHKRSTYRDLAQVGLEAPHTDIPTQTSCTRDPHTVILHKWSYYRILAQRSWKSDLGQETRIQRSCTSGPRGCWCRNPDKDTLQK